MLCPSAVCLFALCIWPYASLVAAGSLTIPSMWQGTTSDLSRSSREDLANSAAASLLHFADPGGWNSDLPHVDYHTSAFAVLALQDYYSGNSTWNDTVLNGMEAYNKQYGIYGDPPGRLNSDAIYWGLAFYYAYRTYNQTLMLDLAKSAYTTTYEAAFINASAAFTGTGAGRNVSFLPPAGCTSQTIAGGVFWTLDVMNDTRINSETVSPFMALSAYLYEQTKEFIYAQAAQTSLDFIINHLWNGTIVHDTFSPNTCTLDNKDFLTYDQAWFVEGLSVWANITGNNTLSSLLKDVVPSVTTFPVWSLSNGVIAENTAASVDNVILKGIFIRALTEARARNPDTDLAKYIEAYVMVQFNSILEHSRSPAPNNSFYGPSWYDSPPQSFDAGGNIAALDVLNAAFSFAATDSSAAGNATSTANPTATHAAAIARTHSKAGATAGGVVGAIAATIAIVTGSLLCRRRRRRAIIGDPANDKSGDLSDEGAAGTVVEPFVVASHDPRPSKWQRYNATRPAREDSRANSSAVVPSGQNEHSDNTESGREPITTEDDSQDRDATSQPPAHADGEITTLARRLNNLLQGRGGELPPEYEG